MAEEASVGWIVRPAFILATTVTVALAVASPAGAQKIVSDLSMPVNATSFDIETNENVTIAGYLHVQATVDDFSAPYSVTMKYSLERGYTATGTSGTVYYLKAAKALTYYPIGNHDAASRVRTISHSPAFRLYPRGEASPVNPFRVQFSVSISYDDTGAVTNANATMLGPLPPNSCLPIAQVCN